MTDRQEELVRKVLGQIAHHAIKAKKARHPLDAARTRENAVVILECAQALVEALDGHVGAGNVIDAARAKGGPPVVLGLIEGGRQ